MYIYIYMKMGKVSIKISICSCLLHINIYSLFPEYVHVLRLFYTCVCACVCARARVRVRVCVGKFYPNPARLYRAGESTPTDIAKGITWIPKNWSYNHSSRQHNKHIFKGNTVISGLWNKNNTSTGCRYLVDYKFQFRFPAVDAFRKRRESVSKSVI